MRPSCPLELFSPPSSAIACSPSPSIAPKWHVTTSLAPRTGRSLEPNAARRIGSASPSSSAYCVTPVRAWDQASIRLNRWSPSWPSSSGCPQAHLPNMQPAIKLAGNMRSNSRAVLGLQRFGFPAWRECLRIGTEAAWATDRGEPIVRTMLDHLRRASIIIPAPHVLERIGLDARARARRRAFEALVSGLTNAGKQGFDPCSPAIPMSAGLGMPGCVTARNRRHPPT